MQTTLTLTVSRLTEGNNNRERLDSRHKVTFALSGPLQVPRHEEAWHVRLSGRGRPRVRARRPGEPGGEPQPGQEVNHQVSLTFKLKRPVDVRGYF